MRYVTGTWLLLAEIHTTQSTPEHSEVLHVCEDTETAKYTCIANR